MSKNFNRITGLNNKNLIGKEMLIAYHNDLNRATLGQMNESEMSIFFSVIGGLRNNEDNQILFTFDEIKELINDKKMSKGKLVSLLLGVNDKLASLRYYSSGQSGNELIQMTLFTTFIINQEEETIRVKVNEDFLYILNDLNSNFNSFKLVSFVDIKGKYVKTMYRLLKQFEGTGFYTAKIEEFRELLNIPESYNNKTIRTRIIEPAIKQLSSHFPNLKCEFYTRGKGQQFTHIKFTFDRNNEKEILIEEELKRRLIDSF